MIRGHAIYEGVYLLGTSIARPLIAKDQNKVANKFNAYAEKNVKKPVDVRQKGCAALTALQPHAFCDFVGFSGDFLNKQEHAI